jgi:hypothetical protein
MKKLLLILSIVATTFALTSCGSGFSTEETTATTDVDSTVFEAEVTETVDTAVTETAETATAVDTVSVN